MKIVECVQILKALADESRLMLVQTLRTPQCVEELAQRCNLAPSTISFHLGKMEKAGLVRKKKEQYYAVYSLNESIFGKTLYELASFHNPEEEIQDRRVQQYREKILRTFMHEGRIARLPAQYKKRLIIVEEILRRFQPDRTYEEREVDEIIAAVYDDYVTIRRIFIDERMMTRERGTYRIVRETAANVTAAEAAPQQQQEQQTMKTRKDLKREYKERKKPAGVFQIKNTANGKVLLGSSLNLEGPLNSHRFMLTIGSHRIEALQADWNAFGPEAFVFEILEVVKEKDDPNFNREDELTLLEQIWLEKLQPFGEKGYNTTSRIRQA